MTRSVEAFVKRLLSRLVRHDYSWRLFDLLLFRIARLAEHERQGVLFRRQVADVVRVTFPDLTVRNGPFKGLRYPSAEAICSSILPKLLGSYEKELNQEFERACRNSYEVVVDIGCAEGYYAVGLATRLSEATIYAFDVNENAQGMCKAMAALNRVDDRVLVDGRCDPETLRGLVAGRRALVVCDCEGFELELLVRKAAVECQ